MHHSQLEYLIAVQKLQGEEMGAQGTRLAEQMDVSTGYILKLSKYPPLKWGLWKALKGKATGSALKRRTKLTYRTQASRAPYSFLLNFFLLFSSHCLNGS